MWTLRNLPGGTHPDIKSHLTRSGFARTLVATYIVNSIQDPVLHYARQARCFHDMLAVGPILRTLRSESDIGEFLPTAGHRRTESCSARPSRRCVDPSSFRYCFGWFRYSFRHVRCLAFSGGSSV
jgi:hypothetical protein